jgi:NAD(P)H-dependent FMN reductase
MLLIFRDMVTIPVLLGTVRQGRYSEYAARLVFNEFSKREDVTTELIDIRDFELPVDDEGTNIENPVFKEKVENSDGLIIVSPEYNHSFPGSLKRMLDTLYPEYDKKAAGIVGVSDGSLGGGRMVEALIHVLKALGMFVVKKDLYFFNVDKVFSKEGLLLDKEYIRRTKDFLDQVIWLAKTLQWGRVNAV